MKNYSIAIAIKKMKEGEVLAFATLEGTYVLKLMEIRQHKIEGQKAKSIIVDDLKVNNHTRKKINNNRRKKTNEKEYCDTTKEY